MPANASSALWIALLLGCGAAPVASRSLPPPLPALSAEDVSRALVERFSLPYCEGSHCLDPFPLWLVTGMAVSDDRIALAGPGGLLSLYADGRWSTLVMPVAEDDPEVYRAAVHAVAFSPDGESLFTVGGRGRVHRIEGEAWTELAHLPEGDEEDGWGATLSAIFVAAPDDLWVLEADGLLSRIHAGTVETRETRATVDRILPVPGRAIEEAVVVSGPFGALMIEDALGEARTRRVLTAAQLTMLGEHSGCGPGAFDDWTGSVEELASELRDDDPSLAWEAAVAIAEQRIPRTDALEPPPGVHVPRSSIPLEELVAALVLTPEGRALEPIVSRPPPTMDVGLEVRREDSIAIASRTWEGAADIWARLPHGGTRFLAPTLGRARALDVDGDQLVVIGEEGRIGLLRGDASEPTIGPPQPTLARATALRIVANDRALAATEDGTLIGIALPSLTVEAPRAVPGVLRAIETHATEVYGVGDDGLVAQLGDPVVRLESGVSADLSVLLVLGDRSLVVGGAAGTVVRIDGAARPIPRVTSEPIVALAVFDGTLHAETARGAVLREEAGTWRARVSDRAPTGDIYRPAASMLRLVAPGPGPWLERVTPMAVAIDEPDARGPYGALRARYDAGHDAFPVEASPERSPHTAAPFRSDLLTFDVLYYNEGTFCCDVDYLPDEGEALVGLASAGSCDGADCSVLDRASLRHRLVSLANGTETDIERTDAGYVVTTAPIGGGRASRRSFDRAPGAEAPAALLEHLASLSIDATWELASTSDDLPEALEGDPGVGFFARSDAEGRVEIVLVSEGNRLATVLVRLPARAASLSSDPVPLTYRRARAGYAMDARYASFEGAGFRYAGPTPEALGGGAAPDETASCPRMVVADADGATTLRTGPTSRSTALGTLENGTSVTVERREGHWIRISAPQRGWLFDRNLDCE